MPFDVAGARKAGYTDAEIADFLAPTVKFDTAAARKAGYTDSELVDYLATGPGRPASEETKREIMNYTFGATGDRADFNKTYDEPSKNKSDEPGWLESSGKAIREGLIGMAGQAGAALQFMMQNSPAFEGVEHFGEGGLIRSPEAVLDQQRYERAKASVNDPNAIAYFAKKLQEAAARDIEDNRPKFSSTWSPKALAYDATVSLVQMAPTIATALAGSPATGLGLMAAQSGAQKYGQSTNQDGRTPEAAVVDGLVFGLAEALPETLPLGALMRPGQKFLPKLLKVAGLEGATEMVTEVIQSGYDKGTISPDMTLGEFSERVARAGVVGTLLGGGMTAAAHPITSRAENAQARDAEENKRVDEYIANRERELQGVPAPKPSPVVGGVSDIEPLTRVEQSSMEAAAPPPETTVAAAPPPSTVTPEQKASIDKVLAAPDIDTAIAAAAETAVASPTGAPRTSLDQMVDETKRMFDEQLPNLQQEKLLKLFGGFNSGTIEKAKDGLYEYKTADGGRFPLQVWEPDPKNPDAGGISPELAAAQVKHYGDLGIDVVYIRDDKKIPFDGVVDPNQPNTIFLSSNPTRNAAQVGQHEVTHVFESTVLPDGTSLADLMSQQIAEGITSEGVEHAYTLFGDTAPDRASFPNTPEGQAAHADAVLSHLFTELGADIGGEAPKFQGFIDRVMTAVETRYGGNVAADVFQKFMNGIREAITTLRQFFSGETQSQKWVTNLEQIHGTLAQMYAAKYGEAAKLPDAAPAVTPEAVIKEAEEGAPPPPTRAGPAPREGYETAKQQATVYQRWLKELDDKRRADAEMSSEVAALRAEEKTILGKVRNIEKYLTKTARARLNAVRAEIEERLNPTEDNEDMALVRSRLIDAQQRMADATYVSKDLPSADKPRTAFKYESPMTRVGRPAPRPEETGEPTDADRFVANQMAVDTGSKAKFSPKVEKQPVFYSALERAVSESKTEKAAPGQWLATIRNMPGIKAEEIKTTGIDKWLGAQTRPVTKAELLEQLETGAVQIEEVQKGDLTPEYYEAKRKVHEAESKGLPFDEVSKLRAARDALYSDDPKFSRYSLPGGENYRELLMTLPVKNRLPEGWTVKRVDYMPGISHEVRDTEGEQRGLGASEADAIADAFTGDMRRESKDYRSSHWNEPNVLAHTRFDERTGPNGERILHVAEIQSDWHQQGRRDGYQGQADKVALEKAAREATDAMYATRARLIKEVTGGKYESKTEALDAGDAAAFHAIDKIDYNNAEMKAAVKAHEDAVEELRKARVAVPDAPFKNTWHELTFKRLLRYAAENGFDAISWDTGATNADRYDLSKTVSKIEYTPRTERITVYDMDREIILSQKTPLDQLPSVIGKEAADKIAAQKGDFRELEGDGLKVGGEGMRGFYDKILPEFVNKYVKKWGGKVENAEITATGRKDMLDVIASDGSLIERTSYDSYAHDVARQNPGAKVVPARESISVHSLTITPAMRAAVLQGQPKFSPKAKPTVKELAKEVPGLKKVVSNLTPEEMQDISKRTVTQLVDAFSNLPSSDEYAAVAYSGRAKRGWYQHSAQAIVDVFGQADGNRFTALLAALSPQTPVESNLENALRTWVNWVKAGRPQDPKKINQILGQSVQGTKGEGSVLDAWRGNTIRALTDADPGRPDFLLSGPKVSSFAKNLRNEVNEVTNDAWMATFAAVEPEEFASRRVANKRDDIGKSFGFKSVGYIAASAKVREAAKILTRKTGQRWTPAEVQETVWSWAKTLYERRDRAGEYRTMEQILKAADMTHEDVVSTPDFAVLLTRGIYRKILEGGKYDEALAALERSRGSDSDAGRPSGPSVSVTGAEGSGFAPAAFERHLQRAARRLERIRADRRAADGIDPRALIADARDSEIAANMSAATQSIPGIAKLAEQANAGDESAARMVNLIAHESLERLIATVPDAKLEVSRNGGLYGGALEPSLGVKITFPEKRRGGVLAALAKFASNFNQEQIHVRQPTIDPVGRVYTDGSYATAVYTFDLTAPLSRADIERVIAESGLYGLNFSDRKLEAYYVGDPRDPAARAEFDAAIERARDSLGERVADFGRTTARLWAYGQGEGATAGYDAINGDVPRGTSEYTEVPRALAERELGRDIEAAEQAAEITEAQRLLQAKIADHYEQLPDNDMSNPDVRRAYEELSKVIQQQFTLLPIKVDIWNQPGEPYKSSAEMRRDVLDNNHMWIFGTSADTFGPPGSDFRGHPLLELTGRNSDNGYPLVVNDELRAVHDYYAHMLSPVTFGPKGEEAAWKNHLATIDNPWARWALTSETRGQNSWVNFGAHVDPKSKLADRPFARQKAALLPVEHMLTGNDAIDYVTDEFIRTLPDYMRNGSLPRGVNDPFPEFSPRVPSALREKLIRKDPAYKAMFNDPAPKKQLAIGPLPAAPAPVVELPPEPEKPPRRRALQPIDGTGRERERAIDGSLYNVGEEAPQLERAARLVAEDPERALAIAMLEQRPPAGVHPEFVFMALEEQAMLSQDVALQERLSRSRIAEEATTMGQRIAAWRNRAEISPVDDMRRVREAREARAKARGVDPEAQIDKVVDQARNFIRKGAKSTKKPNWNDFIASIVCKT